MEVSGWLDVLSSFIPGKGPPVPTEWAPEPVWTRKNKIQATKIKF